MDWDGSGLNGDFSTSFAGHEEMLHMGSLMLAGLRTGAYPSWVKFVAKS